MNVSSHKRPRLSIDLNGSNLLLKFPGYRHSFEDSKKEELQELRSSVKNELLKIRQQVEDRLKKSNAIVENVQKIHLAAPESNLSEFYDWIRENELLTTAFRDLKIIIEEIENTTQALDSSYVLPVDQQSPSLYLTGRVLEKQKLMKNMKKRKDAESARLALRKNNPEISMRETLKLNFDNKELEAELNRVQNEIVTFDYKKCYSTSNL